MYLETDDTVSRSVGVWIAKVHHFDAVDPIFQSVSARPQGQPVPVVGLVGLVDYSLICEDSKLGPSVPIAERAPEIVSVWAGLACVEFVSRWSVEGFVSVEWKDVYPVVDAGVSALISG